MARGEEDLISDELAAQLLEAGLAWQPTAGDQFRIQGESFEGDLFILSHMVIEPREFETGSVLHFNGTTEWALDTVAQDEALWLPREDQLRSRLGGTFRSLERTAQGYRVSVQGEDGEVVDYDGESPAQAYGSALLELVRRATREA